MFDDRNNMREFMEIAVNYFNEPLEYEILTEDVVPLFNKEENPLISEMTALVEKMRSHLEDDENQDFSLGVETGMSRAADMIENLIRRSEEKIG